jgi:hypothetical protein
MIDIDSSVLSSEVSLVLRGNGTAWFDDVRVEVLGPASSPAATALTPRQIDNLEALARAVANIRYRHPSDQSARLNWAIFLPVAVDRVMQAATQDELLRVLREIFAPIAPTAVFSGSSTSSLSGPTRRTGAHLSRWRHYGLGTDAPYTSWREGREPDHANLRVDVPVEMRNLAGCRTAQLRTSGRRLGRDGSAVAYASIGQAGETSKVVELKMSRDQSADSVDFDMPPDAYNLRLGVKVDGDAGFSLQSLALSCSTGERVDVDVAQAAWLHRGTPTLYKYETSDCDSGKCLIVQRLPVKTTFIAARDMIDIEIAKHVWAHIPLAVWTDGARTFPESPNWKSISLFGPMDLQTRLAMVVSMWGTLELFYPYSSDLHIDWPGELRKGLTRIATALTTTDVCHQLSVLFLALHDSHGRIFHPGCPIDGVLPVTLRRLENKLVVVGSLGKYAEQVPVGTEVLAIDHVASPRGYADASTWVPSSTVGWSDVIVPFWLTLGTPGTFSTVDIRLRDGKTREMVLPHVSRGLYDSDLRESRPKFGAELANGVYYIDLEAIAMNAWNAVLPTLSRARVVIMDMRGYPGNAAFTILGHFTDREIYFPELQIPMLETGDYDRDFWEVRPVSPRLKAKLIVLLDGRSISAAETFLQIVHDNHLGVLVGETSAGTNGNVIAVPLPGGFSMRFTGLRVPLADGTAIQGHGIVLDHVVHPTLEGMSAGRDEILEAALTLASHL